MTSLQSRGFVFAIALALAVGPMAGPALAQSSPPDTWEQEANLEPENGGFMGRTLDLDGDTAIAGAEDDGDTGAAYVFEKEDGTWSGGELLTPDSEDAYNFGSAVAIDGDTALVGDIEDPPGSGGPGTEIQEGTAYVFTRSSSGTWTQQAQLNAPSPEKGSLFGDAVALEGDTAIVGAEDDDTGAGEDAGAVYVFTRSGDKWSHAATLTASDASAGDQFGRSLALDAGMLLVGAPDATTAYTFTGSGSSWTQQAQLEPSDGQSNFGDTVDLDGTTGIVGTRSGGSAFVFAEVTQPGTEDAILTGDGQFLDATSVAVSGDIAIVGDFGITNEKAYVFERSGPGQWSQVAELEQQDAESQAMVVLSGFGSAVALDGTTALIGAPGQSSSNGLQTGAAYVFQACTHDTAPSQAVHDNVQNPVSGVAGSAADALHEVNCHTLD